MSLAHGLAARGALRGSREVLTPVWSDPASALPLLLATAQTLAQPRKASALSAGAVADYSVPPSAVDAVREQRTMITDDYPGKTQAIVRDK